MLLLLVTLVASVAAWRALKEEPPPPSPDGPFGLVVRLHGPAGRFAIVCTSGTVTLVIGTDRRTENVLSDGAARFTKIPHSFVNESAPIGASCDGYEADESYTQISLAPDQTYYVLMREQCGNHHCDPGETPEACPGDCHVITDDAAVDAAAGMDAAAEVNAPARDHARIYPSPSQGPCTRTPGAILHEASSRCPKLKSTEPDARAIASEAKEKEYTCTEFYRCK